MADYSDEKKVRLEDVKGNDYDIETSAVPVYDDAGPVDFEEKKDLR